MRMGRSLLKSWKEFFRVPSLQDAGTDSPNDDNCDVDKDNPLLLVVGA